MLSALYAPGLPGFKDMDKCVFYLRLGVEAGSAPCAYKLVHIAHNIFPGMLAPEHIREILEKCGVKDAPLPVVAHMYLQGYGCRPSPSSAYRYYDKAWRVEHDEELGLDILLRLLDGNLVSNLFDGSYWLTLLSQFCGDTPRLNYLRGLLYGSGVYYRRNKRKADEFFRLAAEAGFSSDPVADLEALKNGSKTLRDCLGVPLH